MAESLFVKEDEAAEVLGVSNAEAYRIVKKLKGELPAKGYIVINGKVAATPGLWPTQMGFSS